MMTGLPPGLDWDVCDRARLARDRAFDGVFFTGVRTTGLLPAGLSGATRSLGECRVLGFGSRCGAGGLPAMPSLPTRDGTGKPGLERHCNDGGARNAAYRGRVLG